MGNQFCAQHGSNAICVTYTRTQGTCVCSNCGLFLNLNGLGFIFHFPHQTENISQSSQHASTNTSSPFVLSYQQHKVKASIKNPDIKDKAAMTQEPLT